MSRTESLAQLLRQLDELVANAHDAVASEKANVDWAGAANQYAALSLRDHVRDEWIESRKGIRARFHAGKVVGHSGPAYAMLKAATALNEAAIHAANHMLSKPAKKIDDSLREKLGLWLVPATPGSVVIEFVCPPPAAKDHPGSPGPEVLGAMVEDTGGLQPQAVEKILAAMEHTRRVDVTDSGELESALRDIGVQGTRQLVKFASACIEMRASVDVDDRVSIAPPVKWTTSDAMTLKSVVKNLELDTEDVPYVGTWRSHSDVRNGFDLELEDGTYISGTYPAAMRDQSYAATRKMVEVTVRERTRGGFDDDSVTRTLLQMRIIENP